MLICWVVVFWRLGWLQLPDPDEAHYAELTREMMRSGSWFVPLLDGHPYLEKPILFHWLQTLAVSIFGETEFAVRLPGACAAVALFGITRWVGTALFDGEVGEWGALMFATIPATFALEASACLTWYSRHCCSVVSVRCSFPPLMPLAVVRSRNNRDLALK